MNDTKTQNEATARPAVRSSSGLDGLYACGTKVRHIKHGLTGRIKAIEWQSRGVPSEIPYNVEWDNNDEAARVRGWFFIYAMHEELEAI